MMAAAVTREYLILAARLDTVEYREYAATSIIEALDLARRDDGEGRAFAYGIPPESYDEARAAGLAFNDADGMLVTPCSECGVELEWTDIEAEDGLCAECARRTVQAERSRGEGPAR